VKQLTELKVTDLLKGFNTTFKDHWEMYDMALKGLKKRLIEEALEAERDELICCRSYARTPSRRDYRNKIEAKLARPMKIKLHNKCNQKGIQGG